MIRVICVPMNNSGYTLSGKNVLLSGKRLILQNNCFALQTIAVSLHRQIYYCLTNLKSKKNET